MNDERLERNSTIEESLEGTVCKEWKITTFECLPNMMRTWVFAEKKIKIKNRLSTFFPSKKIIFNSIVVL